MNTNDCIIGVVAKHGHPDAPGLTRRLISWLREKGLAFCVDVPTAEALQLDDVPSEQRVAREEMTSRCSPIVIMGGDGTLISVCRHPAERPPIIIGVNLGTLGFLTEITSEELFASLQVELEGRSKLEPRYLITCSVLRKDKPIASYSALNDVVITKQAIARIFALDLEIDGDFAAVMRGDGVIVSTPGGSTAYSMAAGGSIVHPQVHATLITPICPHSLTSRPLVLPKESKVVLRVISDTGKDDIFLTIDGQSGMALDSGDEVIVSGSQHHVLFAKSPSKNYYEVLATKLKWAER